LQGAGFIKLCVLNKDMNRAKRGRPVLRATFRERISQLLSQCPYPVTVQTIRQAVLQTTARPCSWNTVKKYLDELTADGIIVRQLLPAENKRRPLVLYFMRGCRPDLRRNPVRDS